MRKLRRLLERVRLLGWVERVERAKRVVVEVALQEVEMEQWWCFANRWIEEDRTIVISLSFSLKPLGGWSGGACLPFINIRTNRS